MRRVAKASKQATALVASSSVALAIFAAPVLASSTFAGIVATSAPAEAAAVSPLIGAVRLATPTPPTRVLVFGASDNGFEGDNAATTLRSFGLTVDRTSTLPADLSPYGSIWFIQAYQGLDPTTQTRISDFIAAGGSVYITGERPCCEALNATDQAILNTVLSSPITVGGMGDIPGPYMFNSSAADQVAQSPNTLVNFFPNSPGGLNGILGGVASRNVFATNGSTPVAAVWDESDMKSGQGRAVILMDIDWLGDPARSPIMQNIQNFLGGAAQSIVAFGDSIAAGEGNTLPSGVDAAHAYQGYSNSTWTDSPDAYPAVLAKKTGARVYNFAVSGACAESYPCTSGNHVVLNPDNPDDISTQLGQAATLDLHPKLVTLTIGANDVNFKDCTLGQLGLMGYPTTQKPCVGKTFQSTLQSLQGNVVAVLQKIRDLYPDASIGLSLYFNPVPAGLVTNANSVCSQDNASALHLLSKWVKNRSIAKSDLAPFVIPGVGLGGDTIKNEQTELASFHSGAETIVNSLNLTLSRAAASVSGVTTVTMDINGHGLCEDYPGGNGGYIYGPRIMVSALATSGSIFYKSYNRDFVPSDKCVAYNNGCKSLGFQNTGKWSYGLIKGDWSYAVVIGINDLPHLTQSGQSHAADLFAAAMRSN